MGLIGRLGHQPRAHGRIAHGLNLFLQGEVGDRAETGVEGERVQRQIKPEQDPHRSRDDLRADRQARGGDGFQFDQDIVAFAGLVGVLHERERERAPGGLDDAAHEGHLCGGIEPGVTQHFEHAATGIAHPLRQGEDLGLVRENRGNEAPIAEAVRHTARGGYAKGAGLNCFSGQRAHVRQIVCGGRLIAAAPFTHDVNPHRIVRQLGGKIDICLALGNGGQIFGEGFPVPRHTLRHDHFGNVFHAFHHLDQ